MGNPRPRPMRLAEKLLEIRKGLGLSQTQMLTRLGLEETMPDLSNFVLIGAPAHSGGEVFGRLAVIGPTRMDYQHTITAVSYIARLFDKLLNDSE